jgi:hypothetical protein
MGDVPMEHSASIGHLGWVTEKPLNPQWAPTRAAAGQADPAATGADAAGDSAGAGDNLPAADGSAAADPPPPLPAAASPFLQLAPSIQVQITSSQRMASGPWWPCEVVDPWRPPLGFLFSVDHMTSLDEHERRMYVPAAVVRGVAEAAVWSAAGERALAVGDDYLASFF